jgi:hypothetical protein
MLRPAGAFVVGMAEMPRLPRPDQSAEVLPVDPFGAQTGRATRAAHGPGRDDWCQPAAPFAMNEGGIQRFVLRRRRDPLVTA